MNHTIKNNNHKNSLENKSQITQQKMLYDTTLYTPYLKFSINLPTQHGHDPCATQWHGPHCGWTTPQLHTSDALWSGPSTCKRCGNEHLNHKALTGLQATVSTFAQKTLSKFFK